MNKFESVNKLTKDEIRMSVRSDPVAMTHSARTVTTDSYIETAEILERVAAQYVEFAKQKRKLAKSYREKAEARAAAEKTIVVPGRSNVQVERLEELLAKHKEMLAARTAERDELAFKLRVLQDARSSAKTKTIGLASDLPPPMQYGDAT